MYKKSTILISLILLLSSLSFFLSGCTNCDPNSPPPGPPSQENELQSADSDDTSSCYRRTAQEALPSTDTAPDKNE